MSSHRRGPWSPAEDAYLVRLVHSQGALNWVRIAQLIGSRSPKQCRERYHQNLKSSLKHDPISPEEGLLIERLVGEIGKRWAEIARRLDGRSDNAVKNWWNGSMNRRRRLFLRRRTSNDCHDDVDSSEAASSSRSVDRSTDRRPMPLSSSYGMPPCRELPLPSPSLSEASRAESVDGAPSLMSDNGSTFSMSSHLPSPAVDLPPPSGFARDASRPSLPMLTEHGRSIFHPEAELPVAGFVPQYYGEAKFYTASATSPTLQGRVDHQQQQQQQQHHQEQQQPSLPPSPRDYYHDSRSQLYNAPQKPLQLPPLHFHAPEPMIARDSRMHLSTLLR